MIRLLNGIALLVAITLAVALYIAKTEAKSSQERLELIQAQLAEERRQVNVLNVEIAHLEEPMRVAGLSSEGHGCVRCATPRSHRSTCARRTGTGQHHTMSHI